MPRANYWRLCLWTAQAANTSFSIRGLRQDKLDCMVCHFLADLHDAQQKKIFDSVVVVSDRNVIDQQLQQAIFDFERTAGVVATINLVQCRPDDWSSHCRFADCKGRPRLGLSSQWTLVRGSTALDVVLPSLGTACKRQSAPHDLWISRRIPLRVAKTGPQGDPSHVVLIGTFGFNFPIFISTMAVNVFHSDARAFGLLSSIMAVGSLSERCLPPAERDQA